MQIPPPFTLTNDMLTLIAQIEANKTSIQTRNIPTKIIDNLTHMSLLKSSVYSAQIEGNSLTPEDIEHNVPEAKNQYERQEVENIIHALIYLRDTGVPSMIDIPYLLKLHQLIMHKLVHPSQAGKLRTEPSAIFDSNGSIVYMTPPPSEINNHLIDLLHLINDQERLFPLIKASLAHLVFEKIHPFLDGNGRVGRLLFQAILNKHEYHFNWLLSTEELLAQKKQTYYTLLDHNDTTEFILFMLQILAEASDSLKHSLDTIGQPSEIDFLLPRRREILEIIRDHTLVSFEQIQRRFLKVPGRTLRYDIKQLEKQGLIRKIGSTRGALYQIAKKG